MDRAGAVGGEMGDPILLQQANEDQRGAVFDQVRAVNKHDDGVLGASLRDVADALPDEGQIRLRTRRRRGVRVN